MAHFKSVNGRTGVLKSPNFAREHVGNRPVSLSTTYTSSIIINAGSIDPRETIQTLVEFAPLCR